MTPLESAGQAGPSARRNIKEPWRP